MYGIIIEISESYASEQHNAVHGKHNHSSVLCLLDLAYLTIWGCDESAAR